MTYIPPAVKSNIFLTDQTLKVLNDEQGEMLLDLLAFKDAQWVDAAEDDEKTCEYQLVHMNGDVIASVDVITGQIIVTKELCKY